MDNFAIGDTVPLRLGPAAEFSVVTASVRRLSTGNRLDFADNEFKASPASPTVTLTVVGNSFYYGWDTTGLAEGGALTGKENLVIEYSADGESFSEELNLGYVGGGGGGEIAEIPLIAGRHLLSAKYLLAYIGSDDLDNHMSAYGAPTVLKFTARTIDGTVVATLGGWYDDGLGGGYQKQAGDGDLAATQVDGVYLHVETSSIIWSYGTSYPEVIFGTYQDGVGWATRAVQLTLNTLANGFIDVLTGRAVNVTDGSTIENTRLIVGNYNATETIAQFDATHQYLTNLPYYVYAMLVMEQQKRWIRWLSYSDLTTEGASVTFSGTVTAGSITMIKTGFDTDTGGWDGYWEEPVTIDSLGVTINNDGNGGADDSIMMLYFTADLECTSGTIQVLDGRGRTWNEVRVPAMAPGYGGYYLIDALSGTLVEAYNEESNLFPYSELLASGGGGASPWDAELVNHTTVGTFGWFVQKLLTVAKFLGLK